MKRIAPSRSKVVTRVGKRRWRRSIKRKNRHYDGGERFYSPLKAPSLLSFGRNFDGTVKFFTVLRDAALLSPKYRRVFVDLAPIQEISVPAAIVLAAEFHRWSLVKRTRLRPRNALSWAPRVRALLTDLGVFDLLGVDLKRVVLDPHADNITLTPLRAGRRVDGRAIAALQEEFTATLQGFSANLGLNDGLSEAAENVISHAYPDDFEPRHPIGEQNWWGASCYDLTGGRLRFFIFDHGAGIPFTVPRSGWYEEIRNVMAQVGLKSSDAAMLRAAFEVGRTRTLEANRGLGLGKMAEVVSGWKSAYLRVISGRGELYYRDDDTIETIELPTDIGGTLVEWSLPVELFVDPDVERENA